MGGLISEDRKNFNTIINCQYIFEILDKLREDNDTRMAALEKYISAASDDFNKRLTILEERFSQLQVRGQSGRLGYIFAYVFGVIGMAMGAAALFLHH
ncbi:hypothetical protein ACWM9A_06145 [Acetobacter pasteurianus]